MTGQDETTTGAEIVQGETLADLADLAARAEQDATAPPPPPPEPSADTVQILDMAFGTVLTMFAPNWLRISEENRRALAAHGIDTDPAARTLALGFAPLVELYMPQGLTGGPWGQAGVALLAALGPCIGQPLRLPEPQPEPPE